LERLFEDKKRTKDTLKFTTMEEIELESKRLKQRQETTSMSLMEEKRLIKEMDVLSASKNYCCDIEIKRNWIGECK